MTKNYVNLVESKLKQEEVSLQEQIQQLEERNFAEQLDLINEMYMLIFESEKGQLDEGVLDIAKEFIKATLIKIFGQKIDPNASYAEKQELVRSQIEDKKDDPIIMKALKFFNGDKEELVSMVMGEKAKKKARERDSMHTAGEKGGIAPQI